MKQKPKIKTNFAYFQVGLIIALLVAIFFMEHKTEQVKIKPQEVSYELPAEEDYFYATLKKETLQPQKKVTNTKLPTDPDYSMPDDNLKKELFDDTAAQNTSEDINLKDLIPEPVKPDNTTYRHNAVEEVPIFPGCELYTNNEERLACFSDKIGKLVRKKFNGKLAETMGISGRQTIYVGFTINKKGEVEQIKTRSVHPELAEEAKRVAKLIPLMKPGKQQGKNVSVSYSLPIIFEVQ